MFVILLQKRPRRLPDPGGPHPAGQTKQQGGPGAALLFCLSGGMRPAGVRQAPRPFLQKDDKHLQQKAT